MKMRMKKETAQCGIGDKIQNGNTVSLGFPDFCCPKFYMYFFFSFSQIIVSNVMCISSKHTKIISDT